MPSARPPARRCLGCGKRTRRGSWCKACDDAKPTNGGSKWAAIRRTVIERDGYACKHPGCDYREAPGTKPSKLHADHILPRALGGTDDLANLQTLCTTHNLGKGKSTQAAKPRTKRQTKRAPSASYVCSRCDKTPVRMANMRCPACLPTALAIEAGKKKPTRGR